MSNKYTANPLFRSPGKSVRKYWDFTQAPDVVLEVEGEDIYAHRAILINASPVFRVMLESDHFIEKNLAKICLPQKRVVDIQQLLNFIYPFGHQITGKKNLMYQYRCRTFLLFPSLQKNHRQLI